MLEEEELLFLTHCNPFMSSTCRRHKPQKAKANQNKPTQNAIAPLLLLQQFRIPQNINPKKEKIFIICW
jgi:hypothetical protein